MIDGSTYTNVPVFNLLINWIFVIEVYCIDMKLMCHENLELLLYM